MERIGDARIAKLGESASGTDEFYLYNHLEDRPMIAKKTFAQLRENLLQRRKSILERRQNVNESWQTLREPEKELEETASKETLSRELEQLERRGREELSKIDEALTKMDEGDYGICEGCGRRIAVKRLQAVPWARHCVRCAEANETGSPRSPDERPAAPDQEALTDEEISEAVYDALHEDGRVDMEELNINCEEGVLYLDGSLPSVEKREILTEIIEDTLDFKEIVDQINIDRQPWERDKRTPEAGGRNGKEDREIMMEGEDEEIDVHESLATGEPMTPPDKLTPEKR
jgi:DnaK suppressor protein